MYIYIYILYVSLINFFTYTIRDKMYQENIKKTSRELNSETFLDILDSRRNVENRKISRTNSVFCLSKVS